MQGGSNWPSLLKTETTGRNETVTKVNLREKFALFSDQWSPKIVGELNGQHVKLVKLQGQFVWHKHDDEDELFHEWSVPHGVPRSSRLGQRG